MQLFYFVILNIFRPSPISNYHCPQPSPCDPGQILTMIRVKTCKILWSWCWSWYVDCRQVVTLHFTCPLTCRFTWFYASRSLILDLTSHIFEFWNRKAYFDNYIIWYSRLFWRIENVINCLNNNIGFDDLMFKIVDQPSPRL